MIEDTNEPLEVCAASDLFHLLAGKWVLPVLHRLHRADGPVRFGELRRAVGNVTTTELTKTLRLLESMNLVVRTIHPEVPPRVEYCVTDLGASLKGPIDGLAEWLRVNRSAMESERG